MTTCPASTGTPHLDPNSTDTPPFPKGHPGDPHNCVRADRHADEQVVERVTEGGREEIKLSRADHRCRCDLPWLAMMGTVAEYGEQLTREHRRGAQSMADTYGRDAKIERRRRTLLGED